MSDRTAQKPIDLRQVIAEEFKARREDLGLSASEVAAALDRSHHWVYQLELGATSIRVEQIPTIERILNLVSIHELLQPGRFSFKDRLPYGGDSEISNLSLSFFVLTGQTKSDSVGNPFLDRKEVIVAALAVTSIQRDRVWVRAKCVVPKRLPGQVFSADRAIARLIDPGSGRFFEGSFTILAYEQGGESPCRLEGCINLTQSSTSAC